MAHRPGTQAGRASAVRLFLNFCRNVKVNYKRITYYHVCWFLEHLAAAAYTPGTISNILSHLRTYYKLASLHEAAWHHYRVGLALRAIAIADRRPLNSKDPATPQTLRAALAHINTLQHPRPIKLAVLLMFMAFLRQSNLAPPTVAKFDATRHLRPADITAKSDSLTIKVKWTKTIQKASDAKTIIVPATGDKDLCPVTAFNQYVREYRPPAAGPLLLFPDGNPMTVRYIAKQWQLLLKRAGLPSAALSLHSLRRGGAGYTYNEARADLNDVMTQGTWRSLAVRDYIKPQEGVQNTVHDALRRL